MDEIERETKVASMLAALGNETRLSLFRQLVRAGDDGMSVGAIRKRLAIPASTLQHHLSALVHAGLVHQTRAGREIRSVVDYRAVDGLIAYLTEECCADAARPGPHATHALRKIGETVG